MYLLLTWSIQIWSFLFFCIYFVSYNSFIFILFIIVIIIMD